LYQQFAVTIAISVIISAFNALSFESGSRGAAASTQEKANAEHSQVLRLVSITFSDAQLTVTFSASAAR